MAEQKQYSSWGAFLRLWLVMFFSYFTIKFLFNLILQGWVDLRITAFKELLVLPLGQTIVFWLVTRGWRRKADHQTS